MKKAALGIETAQRPSKHTQPENNQTPPEPAGKSGQNGVEMKFKKYATAMNVDEFCMEYKGCSLELSEKKDHLQITNSDSITETFSVENGQCDALGGEIITDDWSESDWQELEKLINEA